MRPAVFLDRDGVLNRLVVREGRAGSPRRLEEFELLPGVSAAVEALRGAGLLVVVVTNQPDVARGLLSRAELDRMHAHLRQLVAVDAIYACLHDDQDHCSCRKPKPGLLLRAAQDWGISLKHSFLVGDGGKDIEAGQAAGCTGYLVRPPGTPSDGVPPHRVVPSLPAAVGIILGGRRRGGAGKERCLLRGKWPC